MWFHTGVLRTPYSVGPMSAECSFPVVVPVQSCQFSVGAPTSTTPLWSRKIWRASSEFTPLVAARMSQRQIWASSDPDSRCPSKKGLHARPYLGTCAPDQAQDRSLCRSKRGNYQLGLADPPSFSYGWVGLCFRGAGREKVWFSGSYRPD